MNDLKHLLESVRAVAEGPDDARIAHLRMDRWIDYPRAASALETLEELLSTPPRAHALPSHPRCVGHGQDYADR